MTVLPTEDAESDPLIDEIRAIRQDISAQFNNDVELLCNHLREFEKNLADRLVQPPRRPLHPKE